MLPWSAAFLRRFRPGVFARTGPATTGGSLRASSLDWLCLDTRIRFVTGDDFLIYFGFEQLLDIAQQIVFIHADQGNRLTLLTGASSTSDTVQVIFRNVL